MLLLERLQLLRVGFARVVYETGPAHPLNLMTTLEAPLSVKALAFTRWLRTNVEWERFRSRGDFEPTVRKALTRFVKGLYRDMVRNLATKAVITSIIPFDSRVVPRLPFADICLRAQPTAQLQLFKYR